ncbi:MAG: twin-arginine translocase subunit TatC [Candidatus Brocadiaceae bacterium]|nr:twin-arginine translocase subunit TatC [Candidatus Brocadiaceae bacterium]
MGKTETEDRDDEIESIRMSLGSHLEELRRRVFYSIIGIIACFIFCWIVKLQLLEIVKRPHGIAMDKLGLSTELQVLSYQEGFYSYMKLCFVTSVFLTYPFIIYQIWRFVSVGLYQKEKKYLLSFFPVSYVAFVIGGLFGYFLLIPYGLQFLISILGPEIQPIITMQQYVSFVFLLTVALGLVFQLPLIMLLLSKIGFITPEKFKAWRKYSILIMFIISAIITPPDPFTQTMTAAPMILLYEIGILVARPTRKGFLTMGTIVGGGLIAFASAYFYFTHKRWEMNLLNTNSGIQFTYPENNEWKKVSKNANFRNGVTLKTVEEKKAALHTETGLSIGMDTDTELYFIDPWNIELKTGQVFFSVNESKAPVEVSTPNGKIRMKEGAFNIQKRAYDTVVTAVKGEATLFVEGEEKRLLEGRQQKLSVGGEPVDVDEIILWSEGIQD